MSDKQIEYWAQLAKKQYAKETEHMILEMARVGYFFRDKFEVYIHTDDPGNEPHFHVRDSATQRNEFHTCIKIKTNEYFHHTGKEDVLNSQMRKALVEFLQKEPAKKSKKIQFLTNWDKVLYEWNENNSSVEVDEDQLMPNYLSIHEG